MRPVVVGAKFRQHPQVMTFAVEEARRLDAGLRVVHAANRPEAADALFNEVQEHLELVSPGLEVDFVTEEGRNVDVLLAAARDASTMVLGADEAPWTARASGAEIAHEVAMIAPVPVVVVPRSTLSQRRTTGVVAAIDDVDAAGAQLEYAFGVALRRNESLEIVHAAGSMSDYPGRRAHAIRLEDETDVWRIKFPSVDVRVTVEHGPPVRVSLDGAIHASVLVIGQPAGAHPRVGSRSVGSRLLRESGAPVGVVPLGYDGMSLRA